ncbi:hypothetical protein [Millisia brevis]|uniref:hypothetical protein n=1 Tax=Millisia brevis TaxID=264148 RepID=UPI00082B1E46|nr:hypothetical protein [Millisia brevis]
MGTREASQTRDAPPGTDSATRSLPSRSIPGRSIPGRSLPDRPLPGFGAAESGEPTGPGRPELDPSIDVLRRRDGTVQLGWDPDRAVVVGLPAAGRPDPDRVAAVLRLLDGSRSTPEVLWAANGLGVDPETMGLLLAELRTAGLVRDARRPAVGRSIRVFGRGPLSDAIAAGLRGIARVDQRVWTVGTRARTVAADCVVIADHLVPPPELIAILDDAGTPHLPVRIRDGSGLIGPLVVPGRTVCLRCVDLTRCEWDPGWPFLAAQMVARVGWGSPAMLAVTAAAAVGQIEALLSGDGHPSAVDATLHVTSPDAPVRRMPWSPHPLCLCTERTTSRPRA